MNSELKRAIPIRKDDAQSRNVIEKLIAKELIFAVVGPAGSGTSWISNALKEMIPKSIDNVDIFVIKASDVIQKWAVKNNVIVDTADKLARATSLQDAGDKIRRRNLSGVAVELISEIKLHRESESVGSTKTDAFRVYILDSLKNPAEVSLLRSVYQEAFCLIGVVCEGNTRKQRLENAKVGVVGDERLQKFIDRDENDGEDYGQNVAETFHLADFFVDNTPDRFTESDTGLTEENPLWDVHEQLGRLLDILTCTKVIRPRPNEVGMFHAFGAQFRSACLSRQVGAALMDAKGNVVATGTNEVPQAGGGVYGGNFDFYDDSEGEHHDGRCVAGTKHCSNTRSQAEIIDEIISSLKQVGIDAGAEQTRKLLKKTAVGRLLEFSRAVHAEMDALLTAGRTGASPVGCRLFVTTFPCHYCARHIVSSGVDEVQYIEPYPKSRALTLHGDAIAQTVKDWVAPSTPRSVPLTGGSLASKLVRRVLFRPFTGVAPRLFRRAFMKDRKLKNSLGDFEIGPPLWATGLLQVSYQGVEAELLRTDQV